MRSVTDTSNDVRFRHALWVLVVSAPSWSASVSLRYEYPEAASCPDESALRQLVAARLGVDPFAQEAPARVTVRVTEGTPHQADVVLESPDAPTRRKTLTANTCADLIQLVAVTVALAVDPLIRKPEVAPPVVAPAPVQPTPPAPVAPGQPPVAPLRWSVSAGASVNLGLATGAQPNLRVEGRTRGGLWSVGLEGRFAWPVTGALTQGALTTSAVLGAVVPCLHYKWLAGCAEVALGGLRLEGSALAAAQAATVFQALVGLRAQLQVPITERFSIGAMLEAEVPLTRATALVGTERVWTVPAFGGGLGLWLTFFL